jgi:hypothetical protein
VSGLKGSVRAFWKNLQALKQANLMVGQLPNIINERVVWWRITRNMRDLEGSWGKTLKTFIHLFKGVPRKKYTKSR